MPGAPTHLEGTSNVLPVVTAREAPTIVPAVLLSSTSQSTSPLLQAVDAGVGGSSELPTVAAVPRVAAVPMCLVEATPMLDTIGPSVPVASVFSRAPPLMPQATPFEEAAAPQLANSVDLVAAQAALQRVECDRLSDSDDDDVSDDGSVADAVFNAAGDVEKELSDDEEDDLHRPLLGRRITDNCDAGQEAALLEVGDSVVSPPFDPTVFDGRAMQAAMPLPHVPSHNNDGLHHSDDASMDEEEASGHGDDAGTTVSGDDAVMEDVVCNPTEQAAATFPSLVLPAYREPAQGFHVGAAPAVPVAAVVTPRAQGSSAASVRNFLTASSASVRNRKEALLLRQYHRAMRRMAFRRATTGHVCDANGVERTRTTGTLKFTLQEIASHISAHMGAGFDVRKLGFVAQARQRVNRVLEANNQQRAIAIHDARMYEGYLCFKASYAADSFMLAETGVSEVHGMRASCVFVHLRRHWSKSDGEGLGWSWSRFGKSNQKIEVRKRDNPHCECCDRRKDDSDPLKSLQSYVQIDPVYGVLPETRCGMCALERLWVLADGGAPTGASANHAFLPTPKGEYRKFSWEKGAKPMPTLPDGSLDLPRIAKECFHWYAPSPATLNLMFDKWVRQINKLRREADPTATLLPEELWRPHSMRHGAAYNMKRKKIPPDVAAPFLCMGEEVFKRVYGLEEMDGAGQAIVPGLVGNVHTIGTQLERT